MRAIYWAVWILIPLSILFKSCLPCILFMQNWHPCSYEFIIFLSDMFNKAKLKFSYFSVPSFMKVSSYSFTFIIQQCGCLVSNESNRWSQCLNCTCLHIWNVHYIYTLIPPQLNIPIYIGHFFISRHLHKNRTMTSLHGTPAYFKQFLIGHNCSMYINLSVLSSWNLKDNYTTNETKGQIVT